MPTRPVYATARFEKQLLYLERTSRIGLLAVQRARDIISLLVLGDLQEQEIQSKRTKKGELRLKNCLKYDLGSGYRLICLRHDNDLYLLYVGSHDDCDRWLNRQRGGRLQIPAENLTSVEIEAETPSLQADSGEKTQETDEYEDELVNRLDDKILRRIFSGICQND